MRIAALLLLVVCGIAFGHEGRLDKTGGHTDRKTVIYHCHREPCLAIHQQSREATAEAEAEARSYTGLYNRDDWEHWIDADGDCQDTRAEVLIRDSQIPVRFTSGRHCRVVAGRWSLLSAPDPVTNASELDIDHIIPLKWAHGHGGDRWPAARKRAFANDPENLLAVLASQNREKGAKGPDAWLPKTDRCDYAMRWEYLLRKYELTVLPVEEAALIHACE